MHCRWFYLYLKYSSLPGAHRCSWLCERCSQWCWSQQCEHCGCRHPPQPDDREIRGLLPPPVTWNIQHNSCGPRVSTYIRLFINGKHLVLGHSSSFSAVVSDSPGADDCSLATVTGGRFHKVCRFRCRGVYCGSLFLPGIYYCKVEFQQVTVRPRQVTGQGS